MATVTTRQSVELDTQESFGPIDAIRAELVGRLRANTTLLSYLGGDPEKIVKRYRKKVLLPTDLPIITYFDFGHSADDIVPLVERTYQLDIFAENTDTIAEHVLATLDQKPFGVLPGGEANVTFLHCTDDRDDPIDDGDMERRMMTFRLIAYRLK